MGPFLIFSNLCWSLLDNFNFFHLRLASIIFFPVHDIKLDIKPAYLKTLPCTYSCTPVLLTVISLASSRFPVFLGDFSTWLNFPLRDHKHKYFQGLCSVQSVQLLSYGQVFATPWTAASQASQSITWQPWPYSNSCLSSWWYHPTISSSVLPLFFSLKSFLASGSFPISQFFASGGQSTGVSALASVLPVNIQEWFPLGWTGWISLQSKGLSRVFSNTTVQKHQFFDAELSL